MNPEISEKYRKIQDQFNLPHLEELKETFKFEIECDDEIFDNIRNEIFDRLFTFNEKIIEPMIGLTDSLSCMYEQNMLSDQEKMKLFEIYRKIQSLKWENNLLLIKPNEEKTARWINKTWELWNSELEKELIQLCKKLSLQWSEFKFEKEKTNYFG